MITVEGKKREFVSDEVFLYFHDLKKWQLDKIKQFASDRGYFNFKKYKYYIDESKIKQEESNIFISLPEISTKDYHRKVKFLVTEKRGEHKPMKKSSFIIRVKIHNKEYSLEDFCCGIGMSESYFRKKIASFNHVRLNGVNVEIIIRAKPGRKYSISVNGNKKVSGQNKKDVIEYTGITIHLLNKITVKSPVKAYRKYNIELENEA